MRTLTTLTGSRYLVWFDHVTRLSENPLGGDPPCLVITAAPVLDQTEPEVGCCWRFKIDKGWITTSPVTSIKEA
jgi:hypothetical protein